MGRLLLCLPLPAPSAGRGLGVEVPDELRGVGTTSLEVVLGEGEDVAQLLQI
jgi:hypothetical protein